MTRYAEVELGDVCKVVNGGTPKTGNPTYWGGRHAWITPAEMGGLESPHVSKTARTLQDEGINNSSAKLIPAGSVILSSRAPIGYVVINDVEMAFNQGCKGLVPGERIDLRYLYHFLAGNREMLDGLGTGATFKELSGKKLKAVRIPLPPLAEQKRIVAVLDEAFAAIDVAAGYVYRNLDNVKEFSSSYRSNLYASQLEDWQSRKLADLCENLDSRRVPITKRDRKPGDVPYFGASGEVDRVADHLFDEELLLISEDGANLLARSTAIAFRISGPSWVNNHAHVLRFEEREMQDWVEAYLNHISIAEYVSGMAQPKLNQKSLNRIMIPVPPAARLTESLDTLHAVALEAGRMNDAYTKKLTALDELRRSLLHRAFTGQLTSAGDDTP